MYCIELYPLEIDSHRRTHHSTTTVPVAVRISGLVTINLIEPQMDLKPGLSMYEVQKYNEMFLLYSRLLRN